MDKNYYNFFHSRIDSEGYSILFLSEPLCNNPVISAPASQEKIVALKLQIAKLLNAVAISGIIKKSDQVVPRAFTVKKT